MYQSRRMQWFGRSCLFLAALIMLCMPLAHAWHPPAPAEIQADAVHAHHGHANHGDHESHATCEDADNARPDVHQRMQCDCLFCHLAKLPVLTPDLPAAHALAQRLPVLQLHHAATRTLDGHALRPPGRGPPPLRS